MQILKDGMLAMYWLPPAPLPHSRKLGIIYLFFWIYVDGWRFVTSLHSYAFPAVTEGSSVSSSNVFWSDHYIGQTATAFFGSQKVTSQMWLPQRGK